MDRQALIDRIGKLQRKKGGEFISYPSSKLVGLHPNQLLVIVESLEATARSKKRSKKRR